VTDAFALFQHEVAAYHEAGHAVASYALGHGCSRIDLISRFDGTGGAAFRGMQVGSTAIHRQVNAELRKYKAGSPECRRIIEVGAYLPQVRRRSASSVYSKGCRVECATDRRRYSFWQ
jgi:hypothetical protein